MKKALSAFLSLLPLAFALPSPWNATNKEFARSPSGSKKVIIQMFEWNWDSIAAECTNFIGPAGYGYVQGKCRHHRPSFLRADPGDVDGYPVSPPQEHITGSQWWTDYQPVSYILTSKRGNRNQFANMINACHSAGVGVIVDTIWNHMAGVESGTGTAGSSFTHYNYPGIYQTQDFHHCGLTPGDDIANYGDRTQVQTCELVNLADLATGTEYVRSRLAQYGNDLLSLGADGFRLDAAKHIAAGDIANILSRLSRSTYITQEVIFGAGEPIVPSEYVGNGDVQEFRYTTTLRDAFQGGGISNLQNLDNRGWIASGQANVFVANHDTERGGSSLRYNSPSNTYITAHIFSLAHPYGTPTVLSSYSFSDDAAGSPNNGYGTCSATGGSNGWLCQHRYIAISGMVGFRNNVGTAGITNWVSSESQRIAFGRGSAGYVAINNVDSPWTATFSTSLPDGSYCDVITGVASSGSCSGGSVTVSGGSFTVTVAARSAVAIHTGALGSGGSNPDPPTDPGTVSVTFSVNAETVWGENIFLVGSISQLANWNPASALALSPASYPVWTVTVPLPPNTTFQYKFIRKKPDGSIVWESDPNRQATTSASGTQSISSSWR
ncbi:hypothetical protein AX16_003510 [Volvariella volvacea WC 439]|nr:hypothetical protein AX16_003510 [Volvariella volvacea WC 439]